MEKSYAPGSNVWGLGPAAVVVKLAGPIVAGALVNNVFSLGGTSGPAGTKYSLFTVNPFFNYNFGGGWFIGTAADHDRQLEYGWYEMDVALSASRPAGYQDRRQAAGEPAGGGLLHKAVRPQFGAAWQLRTQVAIIFLMRDGYIKDHTLHYEFGAKSTQMGIGSHQTICYKPRVRAQSRSFRSGLPPENAAKSWAMPSQSGNPRCCRASLQLLSEGTSE